VEPEARGGQSTVERIAEEGIAQMCKVAANLVHDACLNLDFKIEEGFVGIGRFDLRME
jgi:hypothetical protein